MGKAREAGKVRKAKAAALAASLLLCASAMYGRAYAAEVKWDIENTLDVSECKRGGTLLLAVTLKGGSESKPQEIASLSGILEYDTSLFTVEKGDILPVGEGIKECSFDPDEGKFSIQYASDITVKDTDQLLQIKLHVADDASIGNTTVCVTNMEWSSADKKQKEEIEHRVPVHIAIQEGGGTLGDVNGDGKVDLMDARLIMQHYNGMEELESAQQKSADVNGDSLVNLIDVKLIMQYYNGEIDGLS